MLGVPELILLLLVALLLFGASLPKIAGRLGSGLVQVRREVREIEAIVTNPPR